MSSFLPQANILEPYSFGEGWLRPVYPGDFCAIFDAFWNKKEKQKHENRLVAFKMDRAISIVSPDKGVYGHSLRFCKTAAKATTFHTNRSDSTKIEASRSG